MYSSKDYLRPEVSDNYCPVCLAGSGYPCYKIVNKPNGNVLRTTIQGYIHRERRKPADESGFLYIAKNGEFFKIGFSKNPDVRMRELQTGNPLEVKLIGTVQGSRQLEKAWHVKFSKRRIRGEWFTGLTRSEIFSILHMDPHRAAEPSRQKAGNGKPVRRKSSRGSYRQGRRGR